MIGYETEEQQVQAIKKFWKDNGTAIMVGVLIGAGSLLTWRWYTQSKITAQEEASAEYVAGIESMIKDENTDALQTLVNDNPDSGYAPLSALVIAQQAVEKQDFDAAKHALNSAITDDVQISDVARLRLANVHLQLAEYDQALSVLNAITTASFDGQAAELKGDAHVALKQFEQADTEYTQALALSPNNQAIKLKLDNIAYAKSLAMGDALE